MKYYKLTVGEKTYNIRVRMQDHEELDALCGGSFMDAFQGNGDPWKLLKAILVAGSHAAGELKPSEIDGVIDAMVDEGVAGEDAVALVMEIGTVSGFFTARSLERFRSMAAKAKAEEEESAGA